MGPIAEHLIAFIIGKVLTADVIQGSEVELIAFLRSMAAKSSEAVVLNALIDALATALGVQG